MAKVTKKSSKKLKTSKKTKTEKELLPAPPVGPGMVSLAITETDLATFVNLMTICAKTFDQLALKSAEDNDAISYKILLARAQLSAVFANKLSECVKMPEPVSRDMH